MSSMILASNLRKEAGQLGSDFIASAVVTTLDQADEAEISHAFRVLARPLETPWL